MRTYERAEHAIDAERRDELIEGRRQ